MSSSAPDEANRSPLKRAGVIGWPIAHSLSPLIHSTWAAREGIDARYDAVAVEPDGAAFDAAILRLQEQGYRGVNVTLPHKERALACADEASDDAREAGAANMLSFTDGRIRADNSDIAGFAAALKELDAGAGSALILGAGGAARGVAIALKNKCDVRKIAVANRTRARAESVAALIGAATIDWADYKRRARDFDIVVNTTTLGMKGEGALDIDADDLRADMIVCDIVYSPLETTLLKAALARRCRTVDGLSMLMHQARPGYIAWLGTNAVIDADLRRRLEAALAKMPS